MTPTPLRRLAAPWPLETPPDPELSRAVEFLGWDCEASVIRPACHTAATALALTPLPVLAVAPGLGRYAALVCLTAAVLVAVTGPLVPRWLARAKRTTALGASPALLNRVTLCLALSPSPGRAARFAARSGDSALARSLEGHVRRMAGGPRSGLDSFATAWEPWFPALDRACALAERAARADSDDRERLLERSRTVVREGVRESVAAFAASIRGPVTAVYAFGVLLPLALVALVPALATAGVPAPLALVVLAYDVAIPLALVAASAWLLVRRPVSFPPPSVDRTHPDVPSRRWPIAAAALLSGTVAGAVAWRLLARWTIPLAAIGAGTGAALVVAYRPMATVRAEVRAVESGLSDAIRLVGRRVERGEAVEAAIATVGEGRADPTGEVFATAAARQRRLGVDVESAFLGSDGALASTPSRRASDTASLLALAATEGRPAAPALVAMGDHLDDLAEIEREARREVGRVTDTLTNTAAVFGPLVGGATVALAGAMSGGTPLSGSTSVAGLGLAVGGYVLAMAVVLTALATGLARGPDRALAGYRIGLALLAATATYLVAVAGTGLLV